MSEVSYVVVQKDVLTNTANAIRSQTGLRHGLKPAEFGAVLDYPTLSHSFLWGVKRETTVETLKFVADYDNSESQFQSWERNEDKEDKTGSITCYKDDKTVIVSANGAGKIRVAADATNLFADLPLLKTIEGLELLDMSGVKFFDCAFYNCSALKEIDLSVMNFDPEVLASYDRLFQGCWRLETVTLWNGVSFVSSAMFNACLNLREVHGLSQATIIGDLAFTHATCLTSVDLVPSAITSIGVMASRRSNLEDVVTFPDSVAVTAGAQALRRNRWGVGELKDIQSFDWAQYAKPDGGHEYIITCPNPDQQYNYPHTPFGHMIDSAGNKIYGSIATWGCSALASYHEWNAVYSARGESERVYSSFLGWWENVILSKQPDFPDINNVYQGVGDNKKNYTDYVREDLLGWTQNFYRVTSHQQLALIANQISRGYPVYASIYSSNNPNGMHGVAIIGMNTQTKKLAIVDSSVVGHEGVVAWIKFEDLFAGDSSSGSDTYYKDAVRIVSDYHFDT